MEENINFSELSQSLDYADSQFRRLVDYFDRLQVENLGLQTYRLADHMVETVADRVVTTRPSEEDEYPFRVPSLVSNWATFDLYKFDSFQTLVLTSKDVFIGDIDFVEEIDYDKQEKQILKTIRQREDSSEFRIYRTFKGLRLIKVSGLIRIDTQRTQARQLLDSLGCDTKYRDYCFFRGAYEARISPKDFRLDKETDICELVSYGDEPSDEKIRFFIKMHDAICVEDQNWIINWSNFLEKEQQQNGR